MHEGRSERCSILIILYTYMRSSPEGWSTAACSLRRARAGPWRCRARRFASLWRALSEARETKRARAGAWARRHGPTVLVQGPMLNIDFDIDVDAHRCACAFAFAACDDSCGLTKWLL